MGVIACAPNTTASLADALDPVTDHGLAFAGIWAGAMKFSTTETPPAVTSVPLAVKVVRTGFNEVRFSGLCSDGTGAADAAVPFSGYATVPDVSCPAAPLPGSSPVPMQLHFLTAQLLGGALSLSGDATAIDGAGSSFAFTFAFQSSKAADTTPMLRLAVDEAVPALGATLHLHATLVSGAAPSFAWAATVPAGSAASVVAAGADAVLVPDLAGTYTISVSGNAGGKTGPPATVTLDVKAAGPRLTTLIPSAAVIGAETSLDASGTIATSFSWALRSRPANSAAQLTGGDAAVARFTPDVGGAYGFYLAATDANGTSSALFTVTAYAAVPTLPFHPVAAAYSRAIARIVATDGTALHLYDPSTSTDEIIALGGTPGALGVSGDGTYAAVHGSNEIWGVDLASRSVVAHWPTSKPPMLQERVAVSDPLPDGGGGAVRFAYLMPSLVEVRNLSTGAIPSGNRVDADDGVVLPGTAYFLNFTPPDYTIARYGIVNGGLGLNPDLFPVKSYGHGWLSADGGALMLRAGLVVRTSDYTPIGAVSVLEITSAAGAGGRWVYVDNGSAAYVHDANGTRPVDLPKIVVAGAVRNLSPQYVFFDADASHTLVLAVAAGTWVLVVAPNG